MYFRVPLLLQKSLAVVHRISPYGTRDAMAYTGSTSGYDDHFREPIAYDNDLGERVERDVGTVELPEVRVPCQIEPIRTERLRQLATGDMPNSEIQLVFHKQDLRDMDLIDPHTNQLLIKKNDRISEIRSYSNPDLITHKFEEPGLFIWELAPGSPGFGPDGFDLYIVYLFERERAQNT